LKYYQIIREAGMPAIAPQRTCISTQHVLFLLRSENYLITYSALASALP